MNDIPDTVRDRDSLLENFAAELTHAAYPIALRHRITGSWLELELGLWTVLAETVKRWGPELLPGSEAAFVCDWVGGQSEAPHGDVRDGLGHRRDARRPPSRE
jgi:hypothetical protein